MRKLTLACAAAVVAVALWWRKNPSACPYNQRFWVQAPHPLITRTRLRGALAPQPGERILEVGPGTGYYSLPVAEWLGPDGTLEIFDLQQEMLDHTSGRAREAALRELGRVVRPGGRVVVGELFGDPHWVSPAALARRAEAAGLRLERRIG